MGAYDLTALGAAGDASEANSGTYGALSSSKKYADLRTELAAILAEFEEKPDAVSTGAVESASGYVHGRYPAERKRAASIVFGAIFYIVLAIAVAGVFIYSMTGGSAPGTVFGYSAMIMASGSMQSKIPEGSLVVTRRADPQTILLGDDISFIRESGLVVTHSVVGIHEQYRGTGARGFETKGIENTHADREIIPAANVIGKVVFHNKGVGIALMLIKQNLILYAIVCLSLIALIIITRCVIKSKSKDQTISKEKQS